MTGIERHPLTTTREGKEPSLVQPRKGTFDVRTPVLGLGSMESKAREGEENLTSSLHGFKARRSRKCTARGCRCDPSQTQPRDALEDSCGTPDTLQYDPVVVADSDLFTVAILLVEAQDYIGPSAQLPFQAFWGSHEAKFRQKGVGVPHRTIHDVNLRNVDGEGKRIQHGRTRAADAQRNVCPRMYRARKDGHCQRHTS